VILDAGRNVQNLTFDTAGVTALTVGTASGNALLLTANGKLLVTSTVVNPQTINAPLVLEGDYTVINSANSSSASLNLGGKIVPAATSGITTLTLDGNNVGMNTISGMLSDNGAGQLSIAKSGAGVWIVSAASACTGGTTVAAGTLRFNINSGSPVIGASAAATVLSGATLELAGTVSALGVSGGNRTHIVNGSDAPGLLISGVHQVVGAIDGTGTTQVNTGSDLTASHVVQDALVIGGTAASPAFLTIAASDQSGNPLGENLVEANGSILISVPETNGPLRASEILPGLANGFESSDSAGVTGNGLTTASPSAVPEPSTIIIFSIALSCLLAFAFSRRLRLGPC
jgi:autotransporter-associated beta strand protein